MLALPDKRVRVPSRVAPLKNCTSPLGMPPAGGFAVTLAVTVTTWPKVDGPGVVDTVVVVLPLMVIDVLAELGKNAPSPGYATLMVWLPNPSVEIGNTPTPEALRLAVPIKFAAIIGPSQKLSVPLGVAVAGGTFVTVTVNVTVSPTAAGLGAAVTVMVVLPRTTSV